MKKRSINILGHQTSISLEEEFWTEVKKIAAERGLSLNKMIAEIDRKRAGNKNLSSAIRLYVLKHIKSSRN